MRPVVHPGDLVEYRARSVVAPAEVLGRTPKGRIRIALRDAAGAIVVRAVKEQNLKPRAGGILSPSEPQ